MQIYIAPYKIGSESAKMLARSLGALRTEGNKGYTYPSKIINWGKSDLNVWGRGIGRIYNKPSAVRLAADKLLTFNTLALNNIPTVYFTTVASVAKCWLQEDGIIYGRSIINGSQGQGIKIITSDDYTFPHCPLYTRAALGCHEYRVHVAGTKVLDFTRKRKRTDSDANEYIRNSSNGWVFCRQEESLPTMVAAAALSSIVALGLDFGAADVLYNKRENKVYMLEVNSAPGIEGTTLDKYVNYFKEIL
jgi:hypothetical protein